MTVKRIIAVIIVLLLMFLAYRWYSIQKNRELISEKPEFTQITRGNLTIPVSATGSVEPDSRTDIKCKASGTVAKIYCEAGDLVHSGELLVELDPIDEERTVKNVRTELERTKANLETAESEARKTELSWPVQLEGALARLESARAELQRWISNFERQDDIRSPSRPRPVRFRPAEAAQVKPYDFDLAQDVKARPIVRRAALEVALAEAEIAPAQLLVAYGQDVLSKVGGEEKLGQQTRFEYHEGVTKLWQAIANLVGRCEDVKDAVHGYLLVEQARLRVKQASDALDKAKFVLEEAEQRLKETKVYAPVTGIVEQVFVREGLIIQSAVGTVTGGTVMMVIAEVDDLYVEADVDEADIGRVRSLAPPSRSANLQQLLGPAGTSQPATATAPVRAARAEENEGNPEDIRLLESPGNVEVTVDAFRQEKFRGVVDRVYPHPKVASNVVTYSVRIRLTSPNRNLLMPGMHANVEFTASSLENVLLVSLDAIKSKDNQHGVYVRGTDGKPQFIPVEVGLNDGDKIELKTSQLKEGDTVYTKLPTRRASRKASEEDEE